MRTNVEKVLERDRKLSELDDQAHKVQKGASQFAHVTGGLSNDRNWWKILQVIIALLIFVLIIILLILADYYISKWLVINKCLEGILGFRWCYNGTSTTSYPKATSPLLIVNTVKFIPTTESTSLTVAPPAPAPLTESILATLLVSTTAAAATAGKSFTPKIVKVPVTQRPRIIEALTLHPTFPSPTPKIVTETVQEFLMTQIPITVEGSIILPTSPPSTPSPVPETPHEVVTAARIEVVEAPPPPITLPPMSITEIIAPNVVTFTKHPKMLKRQHDVLDPAVEVEPVLNAKGQQMYGLHEVPLYKNVDESELPVSILS